MATLTKPSNLQHGSGALQGLAAQSVSGVAPASSSSVHEDSFTDIQGLAAQSASSVAPASSSSVHMDSFAPPIVFSPARTHYDRLMARTIPGSGGLLLDRYLYPVDNSLATSSASPSFQSFQSTGPATLAAVTPLNARFSPFGDGYWGNALNPMGVPTALFPAPSSVTPSSASSAAALPLTSPSSGYVPYLPPSEVLRSVRALQELLFRLFPSEIRPSSPDFDILGFLDNAFELLRSTGDVPTLLWIDVVLSRFSPAFSSVYRHLAKAGFVRFLVCVIDSTKLSMEKIRDRVSRLRKASNESYLNLSARLKQLLRLLRLALIHYPGSLIQEALKDELLHPDLVHQPASVHCPVQALLEGTPLPVEDLQRARVALFYATADDAYHSFFLPRPVGDPTPETELFELMARCELCPIPPPPSEDSTSSMRLVQRHYPSGASVATVWADPDGPSTTPPEPSRPIPRRFPSPAYSPPSRRAPQRPFRSHPGHTVPGGTTGSSAPSHSEPLLHAPERPSQRSGTYKEDKSGTHNNEEKKKMQTE